MVIFHIAYNQKNVFGVEETRLCNPISFLLGVRSLKEGFQMGNSGSAIYFSGNYNRLYPVEVSEPIHVYQKLFYVIARFNIKYIRSLIC